MTQQPARVQTLSLSIEDLLGHILAGKVRIPRFQRPLRWEKEDNRLLIDSVLRGYPVGALLFWKREAHAGPIDLGPFSMTGPELRESWLVVDGQQRITALAGSLLGEHPLPPDFDFSVNPVDGTVGAGAGEHPTWIPLKVLGSTESLIPYLSAHPEVDSAVASSWSRRLRDYLIPVTLLEAEDEDAAIAVFNRLNSSGKPLSRGEVFQAIYRGRPSMQAVEAARAVGTELRFGTLDSQSLFQAFKAFQGGDPLEEWQPDSQSVSAEQMSAFVRGIREAVQFLKEVAQVPTSVLMPYSLPLGILVYYFARHPETASRNKTLLGYWFWRGVLSHRFVGDSTSIRRFFKAAEAPEDEAVQTLLSTVDMPTAIPDARQLSSLGDEEGKVVWLVMIAARPRDVRTGQLLDTSDLWEAMGDDNVRAQVVEFTDKALGRFDSLRPPLAHLLQDTE